MTGSDADRASAPETLERYAVIAESARFTERLRERYGPMWSEPTTLKFTRGLTTHDFDDDTFRPDFVCDYASLGTLTAEEVRPTSGTDQWRVLVSRLVSRS